jgi:hypothetical protein
VLWPGKGGALSGWADALLTRLLLLLLLLLLLITQLLMQ